MSHHLFYTPSGWRLAQAFVLTISCCWTASTQAQAPVPVPEDTDSPQIELDAPAPFPAENEVFVPVKTEWPVPAVHHSDRPSRLVTPMKYFVPSKSRHLQSASPKELRKKYTEIAAERAAIMSLEELRSEIAEAETTLKEFAADQALQRAEQALQEVVSNYPDSDAGLRAQSALRKLTESKETRRSFTLQPAR